MFQIPTEFKSRLLIAGEFAPGSLQAKLAAICIPSMALAYYLEDNQEIEPELAGLGMRSISIPVPYGFFGERATWMMTRDVLFQLKPNAVLLGGGSGVVEAQVFFLEKYTGHRARIWRA